jgi:hypothetical protein
LKTCFQRRSFGVARGDQILPGVPMKESVIRPAFSLVYTVF